MQDGERRHERVAVCKECFKHSAHCEKATNCQPVRRELRDYGGVRFTADMFDCALHVTMDSHSACSFACAYCFSDSITGHSFNYEKSIGQTALSHFESIVSGGGGKRGELLRKGLLYHKRNAKGYPCAMQLGGLTDPMDNIERNQGWFLKMCDIAIKYEQPMRISTKGNLFLEEEYLRKVEERPDLFWVAISLITPDEKILREIDVGAPSPKDRLEVMSNLKAIGVKTSLRLRPMLPGVSDSTPDYPKAYETLIREARKSGARAISTEVAYMPGAMTTEVKRKWRRMEKVTGKPLTAIWSYFGHRACVRPSYAWTEPILHAVSEVARREGMVVGISDPTWKQLNDSGCCCGIPKDDPVFGNWREESATNQLLVARDTGKPIRFEDCVPEWAYESREAGVIRFSAGPHNIFRQHHSHWVDNMRSKWNDVAHQRSPANYFQGAIVPDGLDENRNVIYRYVGLKRHNKPVKFWNTTGEIN